MNHILGTKPLAFSNRNSIYTFCVYLGSSIYAPSTAGVMEEFNVGYMAATLGLALYILGCKCIDLYSKASF